MSQGVCYNDASDRVGKTEGIGGFMKKIFCVFALCALSACATFGRQFDMSAIDHIKKGETTKEQVIVLLGEPFTTTKTSEGKAIYDYVYATGHIGSPSAEAQTAKIIIGADGKVESFVTSAGNKQ